MSTLTFTQVARTIDRPKDDNPFTDVINELEVGSDVGASFPVKDATVGQLRAYHRQLVEAADNRTVLVESDDEDQDGDEVTEPVTVRWGVFSDPGDKRISLTYKTGEKDEDGKEVLKPLDADVKVGNVIVFFKITEKIRRKTASKG